MQKKIEYHHWLLMSDGQREKVKRIWNPYEGDGADILKRVFEKFQNEFSHLDGIVELHCGLYHGGQYIIGVTTRKGTRVNVPKKFEGFEVIKMTK